VPRGKYCTVLLTLGGRRISKLIVIKEDRINIAPCIHVQVRVVMYKIILYTNEWSVL
jgi:hypothetical protein